MTGDPDRRPRSGDELFLGLASYAMAILSGIGDAVMAIDLAGRVVQMNPLAERLTGWSELEWRGRHIDEVFRATQAGGFASVVDLISRVIETGIVATLVPAVRLSTRGGGEHLVAGSFMAVRDGRETRGVLFVFDPHGHP